jgi:hypothetical protein
MDKIYQYTIGFLFGVFILMTIVIKDSGAGSGAGNGASNVTNGYNGFNLNYTGSQQTREDFEDGDGDGTEKTKSIEEIENKELIDQSKDIKYDDTDAVDNFNNINCNENIIANFKIDRLLNKNYLLVLISSYDTYDNEKITDLLWTLDNKNGRKLYNVIVNDKVPEKIKYPLNPEIHGFNINNLTLEIASKSSSNDTAISEISVLFTLKLKSIIGKSKSSGQLLNINNVKGNMVSIYIGDSKDNEVKSGDASDSTDTTENSINMRDNNSIQDTGVLFVTKKYTVTIEINNNKYYIYDIGEEIFKEDDTFLGLTVDKSGDITFHINNSKSTFKMKKEGDSSSIVNPKYPIYINKNKDCDMILYSFALFNKSLCDADIKAYKMYNNYYMYGKKM